MTDRCKNCGLMFRMGVRFRAFIVVFGILILGGWCAAR